MGNATRYNPKARNASVYAENLSLARKVSISERWKLAFRFEAFNIFNRVRWGNPSSTVTDPNFGLVRTQANLPRQMQLGLKVVF